MVFLSSFIYVQRGSHLPNKPITAISKAEKIQTQLYNKINHFENMHYNVILLVWTCYSTAIGIIWVCRNYWIATFFMIKLLFWWADGSLLVDVRWRGCLVYNWSLMYICLVPVHFNDNWLNNFPGHNCI